MRSYPCFPNLFDVKYKIISIFVERMRIVPDLQLKLNIGNVQIELQGEGSLVHTILSELRNEGLGELVSFLNIKSSETADLGNKDDASDSKDTINTEQNEDNQSKSKNKPKKKNTTKPPQLIKDLNLRGTDGAKGLSEFVSEKNPISNIDRTTVFIYYLQNNLHVADITIDHVFTCYKELGIRVPGNLQQNLTDIASSKNGYLNRKDGKYSMTIKGSNFVEHDLPKKEG